ncbi:MAG: FkbM family methyltransferase [Pseudanabaenaceae cyanobacterium]
MTICNVGSRKLSAGDDYGSQAWSVFAPNLTIYGFDADADACEAANADIATRQVNWREVHIPIALGKANEERTLYVTKHPMCSSLYEPNEPFLAHFQHLPELSNLDFSFIIDTTTLDDFCAQEGIEQIDFLQIDVQGADLEVLQGGTRMLDRGVLAIQVEVEFAPLYKKQPLFSDVDIFLRKQGFTFFDLGCAYCLRHTAPIRGKVHNGQLIFGDAFYFRDLLDTTGNEQFKTPAYLFKLACIADVLDFPDYACEILEYLTINAGSNSEYNFADILLEGLYFGVGKEHLNSLPVINNITNYLSDRGKQLLESSQ